MSQKDSKMLKPITQIDSNNSGWLNMKKCMHFISIKSDSAHEKILTRTSTMLKARLSERQLHWEAAAECKNLVFAKENIS